VSGIFAVVEGQRGQLSLAFSAKKNRPGLLFVPSEALGEDLYLASAVLWLHENCERGVSPFALQYGGGRRDQIAAFLGPALGFEIPRQFGTDALHVCLARELNVLDKRLVLDVGGILREREVLDVELILCRLGRGFLAELSRRLRGCRLVRYVLLRIFRIGDLKFLWDFSKRRDKLEVDSARAVGDGVPSRR
jgi:hypothetical protein